MAAIEFSGLTKVFDDGTVAVEEFDLSIGDASSSSSSALRLGQDDGAADVGRT